MSIDDNDIRLVTEKVGDMYLVTSPDVPELHVADASEATAREAVQSTLDMIAHMKDRMDARAAMKRMRRERM